MNNNTKAKIKIKDKAKENLAERLNQIPVQTEETSAAKIQMVDEVKVTDQQAFDNLNENQSKDDKEYVKQIKEVCSKLFDHWDEEKFVPEDFQTEINADSLESRVGYSSLIRQLHHSFVRMVAFHRSDSGGALSVEEARERAFHRCIDDEDAKRIFSEVMSRSYDSIYFYNLHSLYEHAPRVAERLWESIKREGRAEFESGHAAANTMLPVDYMRDAWSVARYLGLRESFIDEWHPKGGIELSLIDMLAQAFFQWQYWLEQTIKRSQTRPREEHYEYQKWKQSNEKTKDSKSWQDGYWFPTYVSEQQDIEHAVQMADRFNRIYMRTLRQMTNLRRYSPVTINNPNQVNIASEGGQQINVSKVEEEKDKTKKIIS